MPSPSYSAATTPNTMSMSATAATGSRPRNPRASRPQLQFTSIMATPPTSSSSTPASSANTSPRTRRLPSLPPTGPIAGTSRRRAQSSSSMSSQPSQSSSRSLHSTLQPNPHSQSSNAIASAYYNYLALNLAALSSSQAPPEPGLRSSSSSPQLYFGSEPTSNPPTTSQEPPPYQPYTFQYPLPSLPPPLFSELDYANVISGFRSLDGMPYHPPHSYSVPIPWSRRSGRGDGQASQSDADEDDDAIVFTTRVRTSRLRNRSGKMHKSMPSRPDDSPTHPLTKSRRSSRSDLRDLDSLAWALSYFISFLLTIFRLLSVVPAVAGILVLSWKLWHAPRDDDANTRIDYMVSILWAMLTAHQCFALTTGLFQRWRTYYPIIPTLIRLLALQAICWPATHLTLSFIDHSKRPVVCWALIGSTTCFSRAIQIWATSNLPGDGTDEGGESDGWLPEVLGTGGVGERRWDWPQIGRKCLVPSALMYFVMAWAEAVRREMSGC